MKELTRLFYGASLGGEWSLTRHLLEDAFKRNVFNIDQVKEELSAAMADANFDWAALADAHPSFFVYGSAYTSKEVLLYFKVYIWDFLYPEQQPTKEEKKQFTSWMTQRFPVDVWVGFDEIIAAYNQAFEGEKSLSYYQLLYFSLTRLPEAIAFRHETAKEQFFLQNYGTERLLEMRELHKAFTYSRNYMGELDLYSLRRFFSSKGINKDRLRRTISRCINDKTFDWKQRLGLKNSIFMDFGSKYTSQETFLIFKLAIWPFLHPEEVLSEEQIRKIYQWIKASFTAGEWVEFDEIVCRYNKEHEGAKMDYYKLLCVCNENYSDLNYKHKAGTERYFFQNKRVLTRADWIEIEKRRREREATREKRGEPKQLSRRKKSEMYTFLMRHFSSRERWVGLEECLVVYDEHRKKNRIRREVNKTQLLDVLQNSLFSHYYEVKYEEEEQEYFFRLKDRRNKGEGHAS